MIEPLLKAAQASLGVEAYIIDRGDAPPREVAILLGAPPLPSNRPTPMLAERIAYAAALHREGKAARESRS